MSDTGVINLAYTHKDQLEKPDKPVSQDDIKLQQFNGSHEVVLPEEEEEEQKGYEIDPNNGDIIFQKRELQDANPCAMGVLRFQSALASFYTKNSKTIWIVIGVVLLVAYLVYVGFSLDWSGLPNNDEEPWRLLICTILGLILLVIRLSHKALQPMYDAIDNFKTSPRFAKPRFIIQWALYIVSTIVTVTLIIVLVALDTPKNLLSLAGLAALMLICYVTSYNPAMIQWHPVFWGFSLQFYFAVIILKTRWGFQAFDWLGDRVTEFLAYSDEGAKFVFGDDGFYSLKDGYNTLTIESATLNDGSSIGIKSLKIANEQTLVFAAVYTFHFFAFKVLPVVIFFSAFIGILTYIGVMNFITKNIGQFLSFCLGTTPAESLNAAGNIFVGMTESPLMIKPFIGKMTSSELHAIMTGGFATIAGSVLGVYIGFGVSADHLLSASVMSAPAALAISKMTYPEVEVPIINEQDYDKVKTSEDSNLIQSACNGAIMAAKICSAIVVNVIAFLSLLKFLNSTLTWFGNRIGVEELTFELICSYVLYPIALFMGVDVGDCRRVAELIGIKTFTNEFIAFDKLSVLLKNREAFEKYTVNPNNTWAEDGDDIILLMSGRTLKKGFLERRSEVIATYALCGFSNFGSMGILLGALSAMAPNRTPTMAKLVLRAMVAGNIACFFTACIAGLFYEEF